MKPADEVCPSMKPNQEATEKAVAEFCLMKLKALDWPERVDALARALATVETTAERAGIYREWQHYGGHGNIEFEVYC